MQSGLFYCDTLHTEQGRVNLLPTSTMWLSDSESGGDSLSSAPSWLLLPDEELSDTSSDDDGLLGFI